MFWFDEILEIKFVIAVVFTIIAIFNCMNYEVSFYIMAKSKMPHFFYKRMDMSLFPSLIQQVNTAWAWSYLSLTLLIFIVHILFNLDSHRNIMLMLQMILQTVLSAIIVWTHVTWIWFLSSMNENVSSHISTWFLSLRTGWTSPQFFS